ncbi:sensor histidine kinase [Embleya sp. AB8]|uniref:sensor histidine kinase n=1 Tax=Embleya sp. AB8 TaxID=3156304 RepID=UPI003C744723
MLRTASWLVRTVTFVVVTVETFRHGRAGATAFAVTVLACVLAALAMGIWALLDVRGGPALKRSWRLAVPLAVMAGGTGAASVLPHGGPLLALTLIAVLGAGSESSLSGGWAVAGTAVVGGELGALRTDQDPATMIAFPLLALVALLAGHSRRAWRVQAEQSAALLARAEELRVEQHRVAVLGERTRIAREIHDVLAHSLGALGIQVQAARAVLTDHGDIDRAVEILTVAQRMAADGLGETRRAVHALRADSEPLDVALARMVREHERGHGGSARLTVIGEVGPLPPESTLALVRTAQESLTNAAKHAPGRSVRLTLTSEDRYLTLTVDNPLGVRAEGSAGFATVDGGYGLTGMRERLLLLGGTLDTGVRDGRWTVVARVPR